MSPKEINFLTQQIIGCAIQVHKALGPGLLENIYEDALCHEFVLSKIPFERQKEVPVVYKGKLLSVPLRCDLIARDIVILELKSCNAIEPVHEAQLISYLRLTGKKVGLLINFNVVLLKQGIRRKMM
jgi:GxxExxY protein